MNQNALADLIVLEEGFTTEFKRPTAQVGEQVGAEPGPRQGQAPIERIDRNPNALQALLRQTENDTGQVTVQVTAQVAVFFEEPRVGSDREGVL